MRAIEEFFWINNNIHVLLSRQHINHKYPEAVGRNTRPSLWGMTGDDDGPILLMGSSAATLLQGTAKPVIYLVHWSAWQLCCGGSE